MQERKQSGTAEHLFRLCISKDETVFYHKGGYPMPIQPYDPSVIEPKWQKIWEETHAFEAQNDFSKPKFYGLIQYCHGHYRAQTPHGRI